MHILVSTVTPSKKRRGGVETGDIIVINNGWDGFVALPFGVLYESFSLFFF